MIIIKVKRNKAVIDIRKCNDLRTAKVVFSQLRKLYTDLYKLSMEEESKTIRVRKGTKKVTVEEPTMTVFDVFTTRFETKSGTVYLKTRP